MIIETTPRNLLRVLVRQRRKFVGALMLFLGVAGAYCLIATPQYLSEANLLVKFSPEQATRNDSMPTSTISAQQLERKEVVNSQVSILQSTDLIVSVLRAMKIPVLYPSLKVDPDPQQYESRALRRFNRDLTVQSEKDADIIDLSLLNPDPAVGAKALHLLIDKFITMQSDLYQTGRLDFLQQQLAAARAQLEKSRAAVQGFKVSSGISSLEEERSLLLRQQADAHENLIQAISKQQEAEGRYAKLEQVIKGLPDQIKLSDENDRFKAVDDETQRLAELRSRQKELGTNYRADSTTMLNLEAQIQYSEQQLATLSRESAARIRSGANPVRQQVQIDLLQAAGDEYGASASRASYEGELTRIATKLADLNTQSTRLDQLELQQQVDEENFRNYLQEVDDARATEELNRQRITSIAVVQQPTVPVKPAKPAVPIIMALGLLGGLTSAIALALIAEMSDESFSTPEQIEALLGVPVLASFGVIRAPQFAKPPSIAGPLAAVALLTVALLPGFAAGADPFDPGSGERLVVRDSTNQPMEFLVPRGDMFQCSSPTGTPMGSARRIGHTLTLYDLDGNVTMRARRELLPAGFPLDAIAILRDPLGNPVGYLAKF